MKRWEYLRVARIYSTSQKEGQKSTWKQVFTIYWPNGETEERLCWVSGGTDEETTSLVELLGELGSDGWELVSSNVLDSVVISHQYGWSNVGIPVTTCWDFKRPIAD
jgi:hypothetical protein